MYGSLKQILRTFSGWFLSKLAANPEIISSYKQLFNIIFIPLLWHKTKSQGPVTPRGFISSSLLGWISYF